MAQNSELLSSLATAIAGGGIRIVDLTETLRPEYATITLPDQFGQASPFVKEEISRYDDRGPGWYWNNFTVSEHTGTHFDAPIHWITGRDLPNNSVDTISPQNFVAPVCVVDCTKEVGADKGFILTKDFLENWEKTHGRIPAGSWVFMRSDWRKVADPANYTNMQADGGHSPGPDAEATLWMINERDVMGFGTECVGTDAGQAFLFEPQYPCHHYMHGAGKYGLQCMTNLDLLPPTGALVVATPLKIDNGSGSPLRVVALVAA
ncbi:cyclase family protein [Govanella unica]|uniref:Cyclase family protein n=1 Tax=Govanella unica TaxID=2975056 RepID=A0A9X3TX61_9PROT|nr:cyclase family protein [Govania unica]MDA5193254.1 cyclase family protein [Govania unica]